MIQKSKTETPIEEIHRFRSEISDRFDGDIAAIAADAERRAQASGRPIWHAKTTIKPLHPSGGSDAEAMEKSSEEIKGVRTY